MAIIKQPGNRRGSLKDIQVLVNKSQDLIDYLIKTEFPGMINENIYWKSPLEYDDFAEYRDNDFIDIIGPINAMYSSFIHDCLRSAYILASGFSFGDTHLKKVFINCLDSTNAKFIDINNKESVAEIEESYRTGIYDDISRSLAVYFNNLESLINGNWVIKGNRYFTYFGGFASFLENEAWDVIK